MKLIKVVFVLFMMGYRVNAQNVGVNTSTPKSVLDVNGSVGYAITAITSSATLGASHGTVLASPGITLTLPAASAAANRMYAVIYNGSPGGSAVTIQRTSPDNVVSAGASSASIAVTSGSVILQSDGTNWYANIISSSTGGSGYIQNQTATTQTAGYNINGNGSLGGNETVTGTSAISGLLTASGGLTESGAASVNAGAGTNTTAIGTGTTTGAVNIGNGNSTQTIGVGNNSAGTTSVKTVNVGSAVSSSATNINAGSGGINMNTLTAGGLLKSAASTGQLGIAAASDVVSTAAGSFILNQSGQQSSSAFNISGNGAIGGNFSTAGSIRGKVRSFAVAGTNPTLTLDNSDYFVLLVNSGSVSSTLTITLPSPTAAGAGHTIIIRSGMNATYSLAVTSNSGSQVVDLQKTSNSAVATLNTTTSGGPFVNGAQVSLEFISDGTFWYRIY